VKELQSRREALVADLDTLEQHAARHRDQLRETSTALAKLADQVPAAIERPSLRAPSGQSGLAGLSSSPSLMNGDDTGGHRVPPPPITGQVPLQPGVEPLVSPRPTSADEVRSMWQEAERAELAGQGLVDSTPVDGIGFDAPTPTDGIRR